MLLDVGPPDVGIHVEAAYEGGQDGPPHLGLGNVSFTLTRTAHGSSPPAAPRPRGARFRLPERKPSRSSATKQKPAGAHGGHDLCRRATTSPSAGLDLQPGGVAVVADAQLPEPQGVQRRLGRLDGGQAAERDRRAVGQGEARQAAAGLSQVRRPSAATSAGCRPW